MTIWPGELMLATLTTSPCAASAQAFSAASTSSPMSAAMAPVPTGTASCMNSPRLRTSRTASAKPSAPETTRAEYSPRLCPAQRSGLIPRSVSTAAAATLAVRMAGWVLAVSASSSAGPSKQSRESGKPTASSALRHTAAAAGEASARRLPMPTDCEPCPGKRNAIFIGPLPAKQRRAPGEAAAEGRHQDEIARVEPLQGPRLLERHVHRGGAGVAVAVHVDDHAIHRAA